MILPRPSLCKNDHGSLAGKFAAGYFKEGRGIVNSILPNRSFCGPIYAAESSSRLSRKRILIRD